ncbi:MAG: hypothetical protein JSW63_02605 [Ignavibacterium sp.]|nr:MAG: hypothetical protein JSW63_02605 [Ignavibacterium sp.]
MVKVILKQNILIAFFASLILLTGCYSGPTLNPDDYVETEGSTTERIAGAEVIIDLNGGRRYNGELLSVRDSTILLCEKYGASEKELENSNNLIRIIKNHDIKLIEVQGESKILQGAAIGAGAGVAVGAAIGLAAGDDEGSSKVGFFRLRYTAEQKALGCACLLGSLGTIIGLIAGSIESTYDTVVYDYMILEDYDFTQLNIFSRYEGDEPDYIKSIQ